LLGVPFVGIYVIPPVLIWYGRRMIRHRYITPPNLVLEREVVPELLQERATPEALADALEAEIANPSRQYADFLKLREALGPPDALQRCASYAVELARAS
jgi:lipid-A-disaccharide synthase